MYTKKNNYDISYNDLLHVEYFGALQLWMQQNESYKCESQYTVVALIIVWLALIQDSIA
jgi:hypothetical protein